MSNANPLQLLRSNTANKRPDPTALADGRPAVNTNAVSPGLFFKDSAGNLVKVGPVHVGTTAPNASPASGGATGNSLGEQWLDTTGGVYVLKIWDGSAWRSETGTFVDASGDTMTGALVMDNQQQVRFREVTANGTNYIALQAPASVASDKTITLPDVNGTVVTTGDTGTVTSTMIADATIVDADISASAEIAVSKLADGTARQLLQTDAAGTGVEWTSNVDVPGTLDVTGAATFDSTVAVTGALTKSGSNVVTVGDTGTVTSTMILDGTIVNADVNASAAIAGTKISPDFGSQNVTTTGTSTSASFIPTSSAVPTNGVYLPAANSVAISTGGSGRLFVNSTGLVGIGTSTPGYRLDVQDSINIRKDGSDNAYLYFNGTATRIGYNDGTGNLRFFTNSTERAYIGYGGGFNILNTLNLGGNIVLSGGDRSIINNDTNALIFGTNGTERARITSAGLVGIGTSSPSTLLHIQSTDPAFRFKRSDALTDAYGELTTDTSGLVTMKCDPANAAAGSGFRITVDNSEALRVNSSGRVGIGTTSPSATLQVSPSSGSANFQVSRGSKGLQINQDSDSADPNINTIGTTALKFLRDGSESMRIDTSGRLLVGTSTNLTSDPVQISLSQADSLGGLSITNQQWYGYGARILFQSKNNSAGDIKTLGAIVGEGDGQNKGRLVFSTTADGLSSPTERMRITSAGQVNVYGSGTQGFLLTQFGSNYPARVYEAGAAGQNNAATQLNLHQNSATGRSINAAGTINASGADYAEYMVKASDFTIAKGAVCGVTADGLLTLNYADAVSFVVKSTNPSYVGGDTWGSEDVVGSKPEADDADALVQWEADLEASRQTVDRIAFAGQVPVNVMGATPGQYIVPVEAADGGIEGVAKNETDMTLAEYMRAVGKVIAIEDDGRARIIVKVA